jgi:1,4-alpha-glucan branching enzyme
MLQMGSNIIKENEVSFRVFAYNLQTVGLVVKNEDKTEVFPLDQEEEHIFSTVLKGLPQARYTSSVLMMGIFPTPTLTFNLKVYMVFPS